MTVDIFGTEIKFTFSFALTLTLMLILCDENIVLMCVASSFLHEGGHLFFMRLCGEKILSIDLGAFGVRIERAYSSAISYKKEAVVASGGIIINFLLAFLSIIYYYLMQSKSALTFSLINLLIAFFNCIPIYVLDMGRVLRNLFMLNFNEEVSEKILNGISVVFVSLLAAFCCIYNLSVGVNISLIAVTVYLSIITLFKKWS